MVTLVSTLHDPEGRMVEAAHRLLARITDLYEAVVVVSTSTTSPRLLESLRGAKVHPLAASDGCIGVGRRYALQLGLDTGAKHLHYCDFDRTLHWVQRYPEELASVIETIPRHDFLIIGRSERAFASHPRVQRDTEAITNHAFSLWLGRPVDVSAGSCGVSRRAAELLLERSTAPTNATDTEWPALVHLSEGFDLGFRQTEGLEFETPDLFPEEVAAAGSLEAWMEQRSRPLQSWITRTRLTLESLQAVQAIASQARTHQER